MRHTLPLALAAALVASALSVAAQSSTQPATTSKTKPQTDTSKPAPPKGSAAMRTDRQFLIDAARSGRAEVELGKLAIENGFNSKVRAFGQRMVMDHGNANDELKSFATVKNIALPTSLDAAQQATKDRLAKLTGSAFDRAYIAEMVKGHEAAAAAFHKETATGTDNEIKAWAAKTEAIVETHLKMARDIQLYLGRPTPTP